MSSSRDRLRSPRNTSFLAASATTSVRLATYSSTRSPALGLEIVCVLAPSGAPATRHRRPQTIKMATADECGHFPFCMVPCYPRGVTESLPTKGGVELAASRHRRGGGAHVSTSHYRQYGDAQASRRRHKRARKRPSKRLAVAVVAPVVVGASAPAAMAWWPSQPDPAGQTLLVKQLDEPRRPIRVSRATERTPVPTPPPPPPPAPVTTEAAPPPPPPPEPVPEVVGHVYATAALKIREAPATHAAARTVVEWGTKLGVTGKQEAKWVQVVYDDAPAWVNGDYISEDKPARRTASASPSSQTSSPSASASRSSSASPSSSSSSAEPSASSSGGGISYAPCPSGSSVEDGLTPDAIRVHRAVCAEFPGVSSYGGLRGGGGAHGEGRALDIMIGSNSSLGDAIAAFVRSNYKALGVSEVIWQQRIWTVQRSSEGWRPMEDRGSATANHMDHVHVTVYGNSGG
jgi:uncharacterized protein YgiM (DUF1202 family)